MKEYRVYYMGVFCTSFDSREEALNHVATLANTTSDNYEDYEILDGSDLL